MIPTVLNVRKPRQKSSRWLLVDFETNEQAEEFKKILIEKKKEIAKIKVKTQKLNIKDNSASTDDTNDRQQYINSLTKQTFQSKSLEKYSNKLLVTNLPETITKSELVELFPHHLSIDLKTSPKLRAIIAYSSVKEAMAARMQVRPQLLNGHKIRVILLLLEDETRKQKPSTAPTAGSESKKTKREPHKFIKPLRYFENDIE
jgi:RNA recognition motif-containing protein